MQRNSLQNACNHTTVHYCSFDFKVLSHRFQLQIMENADFYFVCPSDSCTVRY